MTQVALVLHHLFKEFRGGFKLPSVGIRRGKGKSCLGCCISYPWSLDGFIST